MIALVDLAASRQRENPGSNPVYCIAQVQVAANELGVGLDKWQPIDLAYPPPFVLFSNPCACARWRPLPTLQLQGGRWDVCNHCVKKGRELLQ